MNLDTFIPNLLENLEQRKTVICHDNGDLQLRAEVIEKLTKSGVTPIRLNPSEVFRGIGFEPPERPENYEGGFTTRNPLDLLWFYVHPQFLQLIDTAVNEPNTVFTVVFDDQNTEYETCYRSNADIIRTVICDRLFSRADPDEIFARATHIIEYKIPTNMHILLFTKDRDGKNYVQHEGVPFVHTYITPNMRVIPTNTDPRRGTCQMCDAKHPWNPADANPDFYINVEIEWPNSQQTGEFITYLKLCRACAEQLSTALTIVKDEKPNT